MCFALYLRFLSPNNCALSFMLATRTSITIHENLQRMTWHFEQRWPTRSCLPSHAGRLRLDMSPCLYKTRKNSPSTEPQLSSRTDSQAKASDAQAPSSATGSRHHAGSRHHSPCLQAIAERLTWPGLHHQAKLVASLLIVWAELLLVACVAAPACRDEPGCRTAATACCCSPMMLRSRPQLQCT